MKIIRAFDSCFVAAYKMINNEDGGDTSALAVIAATLIFYWSDVVIILDYTGCLSILGWRGRNVIFVGGLCIAILLMFFYMPRIPKILSDSDFELSQYRIFRYAFFCLPVIMLFILIFVSITFPGA